MREVKKYKKKPVEVEAIQFINAKDETIAKISKFMEDVVQKIQAKAFLYG